MKKALTVFAAVFALGCVIAPNAFAGPLSLTDPGVVGIYSLNGYNINSDPTTETSIANFLLAMGPSDTIVGPGTAPKGPSQFQTGPTDYSGVLDLGVQGPACADAPSTCFQVPAGTLYALGKYDGPNAGYVLFYIPTYGTSVPQNSFDIWVNPEGVGYGLSHLTTFGSTTVPDGGSMAILLGMALIGLGGLRRMLK